MIRFSHSRLSTARSCLRKYKLSYVNQLELDEGEPEALAVGSAWHEAFDNEGEGALDPYAALTAHAPNELWAEKLRRMYGAYCWYYGGDNSYEVIETERQFEFEILPGVSIVGFIDAVVKTADGRIGIIERKTTGQDIGAGAKFWDRLEMAIQPAIYSLALPKPPDFIVYDVARKPTINPKKISAKQVRAWMDAMQAGTPIVIGDETMDYDQIARSIDEGKESPAVYGARLTSDMGEQPGKYFARREIVTTEQIRSDTMCDLRDQIGLLMIAEESGALFRNTDACDQFGTCEFFQLCSAGVNPAPGAMPSGYRARRKSPLTPSPATDTVS